LLGFASRTLLILLCALAALSCGDDSTSSAYVDAGDAGGAQSGGMDAAVGMDATVPDPVAECEQDSDCDNGIFCDGAELCMPSESDQPSGCVDSVMPCEDGELCDEAGGACMPSCEVEEDADGDGHLAILCGGDDCDDNDPGRFPGNPEFCDAEGRDEDCDSTTFGDRDTDNDGFIDQRCCNTDADGVALCGDDCDDFNRTRNPAETEVCDELDNNCDGETDEGVRDSGFADLDGDLHGDPNSPIAEACAGRAGFSLLDDDCDDTDPAIHGAQAEVCDAVDNDCDLTIDEDAMPAAWYPDTDGDGFGDPAGQVMQSCSPPADHSLLDTDCDDTDAAIHPAAAEICDVIDNNCDGRIDDGVTSDGFDDADEDGYGSDAFPRLGCDGVPGFSLVGGDCDDDRADVSPIDVETCDQLDNDCDGDIDETVRVDGFADEDRDLYGDDARPIVGCQNTPGLATEGGDCDDTDPSVHPSQPELCDGIDNDCDLAIDEESMPVTWYIDADADGFGAADGDTQVSCFEVPGYALLPLDCDDSRPSINPSAPERCDGIDNDCNGVADYLIGPGDSEDNDGDGYADLMCPGGGGSDCDDTEGASYPGAAEICDGKDNDCNGQVDENIETLFWLPDLDGDGYGDDLGLPVESCLPVAGHAPRGGDCDDANPDRRPGLPDTCNDIDIDCDGSIDEDAARNAYYLDEDGDGFNGGEPIVACVAPSGGKLVSADCADDDNTIFPGAAEVCDSIDNDCDDTVDEGVSISGWVDDDGDLHGDPARPITVCSGIGGVALVNDDCDDTDPSRHGGQVEVCDNVDNDCDMLVDEGVQNQVTPWYNDNDADGFGDPNDPDPIVSCTPQPLHSIRTGDCDDADPDIHEGAPELCDNIDNDCDGSADEGLLDLVPEVCDGSADDDCDGQVDEGCECVIGNIETCGIQVGQCELGVRACNNPGVWSACLGGVEPQPELCDGLDNDCDGVDDLAEGCTCIDTDPPRTCGEFAGIGVCTTGLQACIGGDWASCVGNIAPSTEQCDGLDNNCDGDTDEGDTCRIFAVGGTITGLSGEIELTKGGEKIVLDADGPYAFGVLHFEGDPYQVSITGQPDDQECTIANGQGTVPMADVADVDITCTTVYRVGGDVSGILSGTLQLALTAESGNVRGALYLSQDGSFQFGNTILDGQDYEVTVSLAPAGQACSIVNGTGVIAAAQVSNVMVTCLDAPYTIGGTLMGAGGDVTLGLGLSGYGTDSVVLGGDGSFTFAMPVPDGASYLVMILDSPPTQSCTLTGGVGQVMGASVMNVDVACVNMQPVAGTASGLGGDVGVSLNGGPVLDVTQDGTFKFPDYLLEGTPYAVTLVYEPLGQACMLTNASGTVAAVPVSDVLLDCVDHPYTVGGDVTGLSGVARLQLNGGPELTVSSGSFTFPENVPEAYDYDVTLVGQPSGHICSVVGGTGTVAGASVTDVQLDCHPEMTYSVGGDVSGLSGALTLTLQVLGDTWDEVVMVDGSFAFDTWLSDGLMYAVSVSSEPADQTCTVSQGLGVIAGANVTTVSVSCTDTEYRVGGTVSGLTDPIVLSVNGGDDLVLNADGMFQFPDKFEDGAAYAVAIVTQPMNANCTLTNGSGNVSGADVTNVAVDCDGNPTIVDSFLRPGAVSGPIDVVSITASEPLDPGSIAGVVLVTWAGPDGAFGNLDDVPLMASMTDLINSGTTIELSFAQLLQPGRYYIDIGPGATDLAGSPLAPDAWYFTIFGSGDIDFDGVPDSDEPALGLTVGLFDTDGNGISDGFEDFDGDGLVNTAEYLSGTNATVTDSDVDGITDDVEDEDWDGLGNAEEFAWGTDAAEPDTDFDGWYDILEVQRGGDPLRTDSGPVLYQVAYPPVQATVVDPTDEGRGNTVVAYPPIAATIVDVSSQGSATNIVIGSPPIQLTVVDVTGDPEGEPNITIAYPQNIQVTVVDVSGPDSGGNIAIASPPVQVTVVDVSSVGGNNIAIASPPIQTTVVEMGQGQGGMGNITVGAPPVEVDFE